MDELDRRAFRFVGRCIRMCAYAALWLCFWPILAPYYVVPRIWKARRMRRIQQESAERAEHEQRVRRHEQQKAAADARRRVNARARCELLYNTHAPEIGARFPRESFDRFLDEYMGDGASPAEVEHRGKELAKIIEQHRQTVKPDKQPRTIQHLAEWYLQERQRIDSLPLEDELKQEHHAALDMRYAELTQELLQRIAP